MGKLEGDLKQGSSMMDRFLSGLGVQWASSAFSMKAGLASVAAAASAAALSIHSLAKSIDGINDAAKRLGLGVEKFQQIQQSAALSGVEVQTLFTAMSQLTDKMGQIGIAGDKTVDVFRRLQQESGKALDFSTRQTTFDTTLEALAAITDETKRAQIATDLFGARAAGAILPYIEDLKENQRLLKENNSIISKETVETYAHLADTFDLLASASKKAFAEGLEPIAHWMDSMLEKVPAFFSALRSGSASFAESLTGKGVTAETSGMPGLPSLPTVSGETKSKLGIFGSVLSTDTDKQIPKVVAEVKEAQAGIATASEETAVAMKEQTTALKEQTLSLEQIALKNRAEESRIKSLKDNQEWASNFQTTVRDTFSNLGSYVMKGDLKGALQSMFDSVFDVISKKLMSQIYDASIGQMMGSGGVGGIGGMLGSLFGGGGGSAVPAGAENAVSTPGGTMFMAAEGGMIPGGKPSLVGENGPELFIPAAGGGMVASTEALQGLGGGTTIVMNNNFQGVNSVNRQELSQALLVQRQQIMGSVAKGVKNGGAYSKTMQGRA